MGKNKKLTREQLIRRINLIQEDMTNIYTALKELDIDTSIENSIGTSVDTYVSNIEMCCDIDSNGVPTDADGYRIETEWLTSKEYDTMIASN